MMSRERTTQIIENVRDSGRHALAHGHSRAPSRDASYHRTLRKAGTGPWSLEVIYLGFDSGLDETLRKTVGQSDSASGMVLSPQRKRQQRDLQWDFASGVDAKRVAKRVVTKFPDLTVGITHDVKGDVWMHDPHGILTANKKAADRVRRTLAKRSSTKRRTTRRSRAA